MKGLTTIGNASEWFAHSSENGINHSAIREMLDAMAKNGHPLEFYNDSFFDALTLTEAMFERTHKSIRMLSGPGCEMLLNTLQRSFCAALGRLKNAKGSARIIILTDHKSEFFSSLEEEYNPIFKVSLAAAKQPVSHFLVCDSEMARIEDPHSPLGADSASTEVKAKVYFKNPIKAESLDVRFEACWAAANP